MHKVTGHKWEWRRPQTTSQEVQSKDQGPQEGKSNLRLSLGFDGRQKRALSAEEAREEAWDDRCQQRSGHRAATSGVERTKTELRNAQGLGDVLVKKLEVDGKN